MMKSKYILALTIPAIFGCAVNEITPEAPGAEEGLIPITLGNHIEQEYATRADQNGFADEDKIGTFIVDYEDGKPGELKLTGNRADNLYYKYNEAGNRWVPSYDVYFKDKNTPVDIYGYYPAGNPESISEYAFEVQKDQRCEAKGNNLSGYEQSDLLWAKAEKKTSDDKIIWLNFHHKMAGIHVTLFEGMGFEAGEFAKLKKDVLILNTVRKATVNLATGGVMTSGEVPETGIIPAREGDGEFRAIVVPQTIAPGSKVLYATVNGRTYTLYTDDGIVYSAGKQHNFRLMINKLPAGDYEFTLANESITVWENDKTSHNGIAREYVVINLDTPGTLDAVIASKGLTISKVRNLKLTGKIGARDFAVMKYLMTDLSCLNLKEAEICETNGGNLGFNNSGYNWCHEDCIPEGAMSNKRSMTSLILPDKLKKIGNNAFADCNGLTGSLIIPEGVTEIDYAAFRSCTNLNGVLKLPSTLKTLGRVGGYTSYWDGAFKDCGFICELQLP